MAILYTFQILDPNEVGPWPPSVLSSTWLTSLSDYFKKNASLTPTGALMIFADETGLNNFLNTYRCTDSALLADIATWKSAHGVEYHTNYYTLPDAGITTAGIVS